MGILLLLSSSRRLPLDSIPRFIPLSRAFSIGIIDDNWYQITGSVSIQTAPKSSYYSISLTTSTSDAGNWSAESARNFSPALNLSTVKSIGFWLKSPPTALSFTFRFFFDAGGTNRSSYTENLVYPTLQRDDWVFYSFPLSAMSVTGSANYANVVRILLKVTASSNTSNFLLNDIFVAETVLSENGAVIIRFDDGNASDILQAKSVLDAYGYKANSFIVSSNIGNSGFLTVGQLQTLYNAGWDICNHSATHANLNSLDDVSVANEINVCKNFLISNGLLRGSEFFASPQVPVSNRVNQISKHLNKVVSNIHSKSVTENSFLPYPLFNPHRLDGIEVLHTTSVANLQAWALNVKQAKGLGVCIFKKIVTGTPVAGEYNVNNFATFIAYLNSQDIPVITVSDAVRLYSTNINYPPEKTRPFYRNNVKTFSYLNRLSDIVDKIWFYDILLEVNDGLLFCQSPVVDISYVFVSNCFHTCTSTSLTLVQHSILSPVNCFHTCISTSPTLVQHFTLSPANCFHGVVSPNIALDVRLSVNSANHAVMSHQINFTVHINISDSLHSVVSSDITLAQTHILAVNSSIHNHIATNIILDNVLAVNNCLHDVISPDIILTQAYILTVNNGIHNHITTNIILDSILAVNNCFHDVISTNITLTQTHILATNSSTHNHIATNIIFGDVLAVNNCFHDVISTNIALTQAYVLTVNSSIHNHIATNIIFDITLAVNDCFHSVISTDIVLTQAYILVVNNSIHNHIATNIIFGNILAVNNCFHNTISTDIVLTHRHTLAVSPCFHAHIGQSFTFFVSLIISACRHSIISSYIDIDETVWRRYKVKKECDICGFDFYPRELRRTKKDLHVCKYDWEG